MFCSFRESELEPSAETYKTLMCGYAAIGNIEEIHKVSVTLAWFSVSSNESNLVQPVVL